MSIDKITAVIICFNEEDKIERCLRSVAWVDEVIVVDSFSTDSTLERVRKHTSKVYQHTWEGMISQKKFATSMASNDWILSLDADEELSGGLIREIKETFSADSQKPDAYIMPRKALYLDRWINHCGWFPDYKLRLFKKSKAAWGGVEPHDEVFVSGEKRFLKNDLYHYSFDDIADHINRMNSYTTINSQELMKKGVKCGPFKPLLRSFYAFIKMYFLKKGFMDGVPGLVVCMISSFHVFAKYAKLWELYNSGKSAPPDNPDEGRHA